MTIKVVVASVCEACCIKCDGGSQRLSTDEIVKGYDAAGRFARVLQTGQSLGSRVPPAAPPLVDCAVSERYTLRNN